eukprot:TRINITY_DN9692_c0_g1_i1.p1 TRINITY_DN9692_c0_g1~~TRINITY_DN9692_c0_g1_i1.p1  ORF type:complete len:481 (-),score=93.82 TRINITY_DN9692_c0_g1_i1:8-1450(-)
MPKRGRQQPAKPTKQDDGPPPAKRKRAKTRTAPDVAAEVPGVPAGGAAPLQTWHLQRLLGEIPKEQFLSEFWERKPLHIKRGDAAFYGDLFSKQELFEVIGRHQFDYGKQVNVARFENGRKRVMNGTGRVSSEAALRHYNKDRCTVQLLAPQQFSDRMAELNTALEEEFSCLVGANAYLTPAKAQGFAPHWDDVDVFILQLEGKKEWYLHELKPADQLPREYSRDFRLEEVGTPDHTVTLETGDMLYLPRGVIHYAKTSEIHSLHMTVSTYQKWSWSDFLQTALPLAVDAAASQDVEFRRGMPVDFIRYMGSGHRQDPNSGRTELAQRFTMTCHQLIQRLVEFVDVHEASDVHLLSFLANRMRPLGDHVPVPSPKPTARLRWRNPGWVRLVLDKDDKGEQFCFVYHCLANDREHNMEGDHLLVAPTGYLKFPPQFVQALGFLFVKHPGFVSLGELPGLSAGEQNAMLRDLNTAHLLDVQD